MQALVLGSSAPAGRGTCDPPGARLLRSFYLRSGASRSPLRIGLLLDGPACPRFAARVMEDIVKSDFARLDFVVYKKADADPRPAARAPLPMRLWRLLRRGEARKLLLYDAYLRIDGKRCSADDDPVALVDCSFLLSGVESIEVHPIVKGFTHRFTAIDLEQIQARQLDVLLRFGFNILRGEILEAARYGVWSFHHDDNDHYRGGPAGFWELYEGNPISGVMLQVLTEDLDAGLVLCKSRFATTRGVSLARNRYGPYWGSTHFVIRKLHELHQYGWEHVKSRAEVAAPYRGKRATYRRPTNIDMARFLVPAMVKTVVRRATRSARRRQWKIAVRVGARPLYDRRGPADMTGFSWIECLPGHSYAHPFLIARDDRIWAFFRDFSPAESRAVISSAEVFPRGGLGPIHRCLERSHDLSYPMVFEWEGEVFMIPGSSGNGTIDLYRATSFPYEWKLEKSLHRLSAVNTTVWYADDRWWFFSAIAEPPGHCATLLLFHATSLTGEWVYHPANPISSDVRTASGAGAMFSIRGRPVRPSHDCSKSDGCCLTLNEILELTRDEYRERPMLTVEPSWSRALVGTHTYNHCAGIEIVDGCTSVRRSSPTLGQGVNGACAASRE